MHAHTSVDVSGSTGAPHTSADRTEYPPMPRSGNPWTRSLYIAEMLAGHMSTGSAPRSVELPPYSTRPDGVFIAISDVIDRTGTDNNCKAD